MSQRHERGFTLLEVLVASVIMAIAVVGLLSAISAAMRNAARLTEADRAALIARAKMDELLAAPPLRWNSVLEGAIDPAATGGFEGHWKAVVTPFEPPPVPYAGAPSIDRIQLNVAWSSGGQERTFTLEAFHTRYLKPQEVALLGPAPMP